MSISSKRQPSRVCGDIRGLITNKSHISSQCNIDASPIHDVNNLRLFVFKYVLGSY